MDPEKVGDLYFQKAEAFRTMQLGFDSASIVGMLFTMVTLVAGQSWDEIIDMLIPIGLILGLVVVTIFYFNIAFKINCKGYEADCMSFYSAPYVQKYLDAHPDLAVLGDGEINEIAARMSKETGFDDSAVKNGIQAFLNRTFEIAS